MKQALMAVVSAFGLSAFGFTDSTLAFYAFKDGEAGSSADGVTLVNAVNAAVHAGSGSVVGAGALQFSGDVPGAYLLEGDDGIVLAQDPQSLWFDGATAADGATVDFDGIMDALASETAYTVEFFWKKPTSLAETDTAKAKAIGFDIGSISGSSTKPGLCVNIPGDDAKHVQMFIQVERKVVQDEAVQDGKWHHTAVTYKDNNFYLNVDYVKQGNSASGYVGYPITVNRDASGALKLSPDKTFRGFIAGLRVTKKFLAASEMLKASASPIYDPGDDDVVVDAETPKARTTSQNNWWMTRHETILSTIRSSGTEIETAFLGDSITELWDATIWNAAFAPYAPINLGYTADTTGHVLWRIANGELDGYAVKKVVLLIGTNNLGTEPVKHTIRGVKAVVEAVRAKQPTAQILLHAIFPRDDLTADGKRKLNLVNAGIRELADGEKVVWCDFTDKFLLSDGSFNASLFKADKLHPVAAGYAVWRDSLLPVLDPDKYGPVSFAKPFASETIAFYPFNDVTDGASLIGTPIRNAVDAVSFAGTADIMETSGYAGTAACETSVDRPGKYVFDGTGADVLVTNPRSLLIRGRSASPGLTIYSGARVQLENLASEILASPEYTVEFFWKIPSASDNFNAFDNNFNWGDGGVKTGLQLPSHNSGANTMRRVQYWYGATSSDGRTIEYANYRLADDLWHHIAVVRTSAGQTRMYMDYVNMASSPSANAVKTVDGRPFIIADLYRWQGYISCLRVTKKALAPAQLLHASDNPDSAGDTVFHWTMEGVDGTQATVTENADADAAAGFAGQYAARYLAGNGEAIDVTRPFAYTAAAPRRGKTVVSGEAKLHENQTAASLPYVSGSGFTSLKLPANPAMPGGSFTFETFFRFADRKTWESHKDFTTYCVLARKPASSGNDWWCGLWLYNDGYVVSKAVNTTGATEENFKTCSAFLDGKWHHYGFVYDEVALKMTIYLDYKEICSKTMSAPIAHDVNSANEMLVVGGGMSGLSSFEGDLDEVRFTRRALPVEEFLRAKSFDGALILVR